MVSNVNGGGPPIVVISIGMDTTGNSRASRGLCRCLQTPWIERPKRLGLAAGAEAFDGREHSIPRPQNAVPDQIADVIGHAWPAKRKTLHQAKAVG
jgi:hypothetical protein